MNDSMKPDDEVGITLGEVNVQFQQILNSVIKCQICNFELPKEFLLAHWQKECILKAKSNE